VYMRASLSSAILYIFFFLFLYSALRNYDDKMPGFLIEISLRMLRSARKNEDSARGESFPLILTNIVKIPADIPLFSA